MMDDFLSVVTIGEREAVMLGCICHWEDGRPVVILPRCPLGRRHLVVFSTYATSPGLPEGGKK